MTGFTGYSGITGFSGTTGYTGSPGSWFGTGSTGTLGTTGFTGITGPPGPVRPPYLYFNIGSTGTIAPSIIYKADLQQRLALVSVYQQVKFQNLLMVVVNYHVEGVINGIIQILINNTGQKKTVRYLQTPPSNLMNDIVYNLSTVNYTSVIIQAIPIIISILKEQFPDSNIMSDTAGTYIIIDWT